MTKWSNFSVNRCRDIKIVLTTIEQNRTASGKSWSTKDARTTVKIISYDEYDNYIKSIPFFCDRVEHNYTYCGYIPTRLTSVSPDSSLKIIRKFQFVKNDEFIRIED